MSLLKVVFYIFLQFLAFYNMYDIFSATESCIL